MATGRCPARARPPLIALGHWSAKAEPRPGSDAGFGQQLPLMES